MRQLAPILLCLASPVQAEAPPAKLLGWLHGEWQGTGTLFGQSAEVSLDIAPSIDGKGTTLRYRADGAARPARAAIRYEAQAIYALDGKGRLRGRWLDSAGNDHPVLGREDGTRLTTLWGEVSTEIGRSTYVLNADGTLSVSDTVLQPDGGWRTFASASYRRRR